MWRRISEKRIPIIPVEADAADDISDSPGGFSIFMFSPSRSAESSRSEKSDPRSSRCLGAPSSRDDKVLREERLYLADSLAGLEEQISPWYLEKLTCRRSSLGRHWFRFEMLSNDFWQNS
jgi:hypothetical protein